MNISRPLPHLMGSLWDAHTIDNLKQCFIFQLKQEFTITIFNQLAPRTCNEQYIITTVEDGRLTTVRACVYVQCSPLLCRRALWHPISAYNRPIGEQWLHLTSHLFSRRDSSLLAIGRFRSLHAAKLCNEFPGDVTTSVSRTAFRRRLKTFLFRVPYPDS